MSNKWFSNDKKEDDIVIPSFIRLKQQVLTIKMERAIRAMFQKIITTFNFNIDWIDTSLGLYIDNKPLDITNTKKFEESYDKYYNDIDTKFDSGVNKFEELTKVKDEIKNSAIDLICKQKFNYNYKKRGCGYITLNIKDTKEKAIGKKVTADHY